ncbi:conjugal transfer pilin subunit TraA [Klebsiella variicola]|nr:conjugal transfer pilin subunit TraA [Klebsiella variicola]
MNAVLSVQGSAVPEETKPSFLSRVFNKKKALKVAKVALPVAAVAAFLPGCCDGHHHGNRPDEVRGCDR